MMGWNTMLNLAFSRIYYVKRSTKQWLTQGSAVLNVSKCCRKFLLMAMTSPFQFRRNPHRMESVRTYFYTYTSSESIYGDIDCNTGKGTKRTEYTYFNFSCPFSQKNYMKSIRAARCSSVAGRTALLRRKDATRKSMQCKKVAIWSIF